MLQGIHAQFMSYVSFIDDDDDDGNDSDDEMLGRSMLTLWCTDSNLHVISYKCITFTPQIKGTARPTFTM